MRMVLVTTAVPEHSAWCASHAGPVRAGGGGAIRPAADVGSRPGEAKVEAGSPRTTRAIPPSSPTASAAATTWATWPVRAPTCSNPIAVSLLAATATSAAASLGRRCQQRLRISCRHRARFAIAGRWASWCSVAGVSVRTGTRKRCWAPRRGHQQQRGAGGAGPAGGVVTAGSAQSRYLARWWSACDRGRDRSRHGALPPRPAMGPPGISPRPPRAGQPPPDRRHGYRHAVHVVPVLAVAGGTLGAFALGVGLRCRGAHRRFVRRGAGGGGHVSTGYHPGQRRLWPDCRQCGRQRPDERTGPQVRARTDAWMPWATPPPPPPAGFAIGSAALTALALIASYRRWCAC